MDFREKWNMTCRGLLFTVKWVVGECECECECEEYECECECAVGVGVVMFCVLCAGVTRHEQC